MAKCKKCNQEDLKWDQENHDKTGKWRLWNPSTERPHECSKKPKHHSPSMSQKYGFDGRSKSDLWKTAWKPEMDLPSFRLCGVCNDGTLLIKNQKYWCDVCNGLLDQTCKEYCPKCEKHPNIILVAKSIDSRLENTRKK